MLVPAWESLTVQIVNGYVCATTCDVAAAKKGHDPKNPHDDPTKAAALNEQKSLARGTPSSQMEAAGGISLALAAPAVSFGGALSGGSGRDWVGLSTSRQVVDMVA